MKPASSAFSQPQPSIRRLVSIRRGSSIIAKNPSSGEILQKRGVDPLLVVEEEEGASAQNHFDSPRIVAGLAEEDGNFGEGANAASDAASSDALASAHNGSAGNRAAVDGLGRASRSPSLDDTTSHSSLQPEDDPGDSSRPRRVTFSHTHSGGGRDDTSAKHVAPFDRSPFDSHPDPLSVAPADAAASDGDGASGAPVSAQAAKVLAAKSAIELQYSSGRTQAYVPGSRRTAKAPAHDAARGDAAPAAASAGRRHHVQHAEGDKSGWVDKMKKNIVGFFEGGDSDLSSSDEEHAVNTAAPAAIDVPMLQSIVEAAKAADPPLVCEHKKTSRFALGSSAHVLPLTFKGSALVDWLIDPAKAGKFAVHSRARAVALCEAIAAHQLMRNFEKDGPSTMFKDADMLFRFECDDKFLKDTEAKATASVSKFQKFRGNSSGSTAATALPAHGDKGAAADAPPADSGPSSGSSTASTHSPKPTANSSSTSASSFAYDDKPAFPAHLSTAQHAEADVVRPTSLPASRAMSFDSRIASQRAFDPGYASAAVVTLKAATDARIAAIEARTLHLQSQIDRMMTQIELKDREIGEKFHDIEQLRVKLEEECHDTHEGLVAVQTLWDEKISIYEKINAELPLLDSKIKDFEKRHEDAKDKVDEAQQRLKRIRDQQSEAAAGSGTMTWNDWFMSWGLVISMFFIKWFFAILTKLRLYKAPVRANMQDIDRAKAIADNMESAGGVSAASVENNSITATASAAGVGLDATKQKARVNKRASVMLRATGQPITDRSFMPPS